MPTHKVCETTMQSLERRHSELNIVRNQCACDTFFLSLVLGQDMLIVAIEQGVLLEEKYLFFVEYL